MKKLKDAVVKTRTYKKADGTEGANWLNVGGLFEANGRMFFLLEKWFNPSGIIDEGKRNVLISLVDPKEKDATKPNDYAKASGAEYTANDLDDEIPF